MTAAFGRSRRSRFGLAAVCSAVVLFGVPSPVWAHGGEGHENLTSNYRTVITTVAPAVDGLTVDVVDIDGTLRVSFQGPGELLVLGYEDEPYLRIGPDGASVNAASPAAYLNRDRFANSEVPSSADATFPPVWESLEGGQSVEWHDHRNHWMSPVPPPETADAPDEVFTIKQWTIPLVVDGLAVTVSGSLTWYPPPSPTVPLFVAGLGGLILAAVLWSRWWRPAAVGIAVVGTAALAVESAGGAAASFDTLANRTWMFLWPCVGVLAVWRLAVAAHRRVQFPTLAMGLAGLVLVMIGGVSRRGVLFDSQVFSTLPPSLARWCVVVAIAAGAALTLRFLVFLTALSVDKDHPAARPEARRHAEIPG